MGIDESVLILIKVLIWPIVAVLALLIFKRPISNALQAGVIKFNIFGFEIETTSEKVADVLNKNFDYFKLNPKQWSLLKKLSKADRRGMEKTDAEEEGFNYKEDFRSLRNAGLISGEGDKTLSKSEKLYITPLGEFLLQNGRYRSNKATDATPLNIDNEA